MEIGKYVAVSDLDVAKEFYRRLLESEPYIE